MYSAAIQVLLLCKSVAISADVLALLSQEGYANAARDRLIASLLPGVELEEIPVPLGTVRLSEAFAAVPKTLAQGLELVTVSGTPETVTLERPYILLQMMPRNVQYVTGYTGTDDMFATSFDVIYGRSLSDLPLIDNLFWPYGVNPYYYDAQEWH